MSSVLCGSSKYFGLCDFNIQGYLCPQKGSETPYVIPITEKRAGLVEVDRLCRWFLPLVIVVLQRCPMAFEPDLRQQIAATVRVSFLFNPTAVEAPVLMLQN
jgi:hypothetical protein